MFKIEILTKKSFRNSHAKHVLSDISDFGVKSIIKVSYSPLYFIEGDISSTDIEMIASELLCDKIIETYVVNSKSNDQGRIFSVIEIRYKNGVTDATAESLVKAVRDLGILKKVSISTGQKYYMYGTNGTISKTTLSNIAIKVLANTLVQEYAIY
jgi:phosphoribosylformylglycinamidine (FGAM) synthase PurS component